MDADAFLAYALDPARTLEERYTLELLIERGAGWYDRDHKIPRHEPFEDTYARSRERKLNPAYEPFYTAEDARKTAAHLGRFTAWFSHFGRPIRSLEPFRFWTSLEDLDIHGDDPDDVSPLVALPNLRKLSMGSAGYDFYNTRCADFSPLGRCLALRELVLAFNVHWPDLNGLDGLPELETLTLSGNLLAMPAGTVFPKVRRGGLYCLPLAARRLEDLPWLPACEFLTLSGVERLDGIGRMPRLRNLTLEGPFESFAPLRELRGLTCLTVGPDKKYRIKGQPRDVSPLAALPELRFFKIGPPHSVLDTPRDYGPLAEAPALRELIVQSCPPVAMEVAAIQAGLPPWDDAFLLTEPRPVPPLRLIAGAHKDRPAWLYEGRPHPGPDLPDAGLRECEGRWVQAFLARSVSARIGHADWGRAEADGRSRTAHLYVESFDVVERLPEIVDAARGVLASLRGEYSVRIMIQLKVPKIEATPAQKELEAQFRARRDEWEEEQRAKDDADYLERLHQWELKKQAGEEIDPGEFSPAEPGPMPDPPWRTEEDEEAGEEDEDEEDEDYDFSAEAAGEGGTKVKEKPDPPPSWTDDHHPLWLSYSLDAFVSLEEMWVEPARRGIAMHLMRRGFDVEFPEEKPPGA